MLVQITAALLLELFYFLSANGLSSGALGNAGYTPSLARKLLEGKQSYARETTWYLVIQARMYSRKLLKET